MPRAASQPDLLNISWRSPALEGQLSVRQAFDKLNAPHSRSRGKPRDRYLSIRKNGHSP